MITYGINLLLFVIILSLGSCNSGDNYNNNKGNFKTITISGTVPGTLIEAYGDNGSYYQTMSNNNGTSEHPFALELQKDITYYLYMTIDANNDGIYNEKDIRSQISDANGNPRFIAKIDVDFAYLDSYN